MSGDVDGITTQNLFKHISSRSFIKLSDSFLYMKCLTSKIGVRTSTKKHRYWLERDYIWLCIFNNIIHKERSINTL